MGRSRKRLQVLARLQQRVPGRALLLGVAVAVVGVAALRYSLADNSMPETPPANADKHATSTAEQASRQIIVKYKPGVTEGEMDSAAEAAGGNEATSIEQLRIKVLKAPKEERAQIVEQLKADPRVEYAAPDSVAYEEAVPTQPNDPEYSKQWVWPRINADIMWDNFTGGDVTVAVVDSGVDAHPELAGKILPGHNFVDNNSDVTDGTGHGTSVAGIIAANSNNSADVTGACWGCKILPLKVVAPDGIATESRMAEAVVYAADNGVKTINMSLGGTDELPAVRDAIDYATDKGAIVTTSAGNDGTTDPHYPSDYPNALSVGSLYLDDKRSSYSNYGPEVDIAAPGDHIVLNHASGTEAGHGTSYSAPTAAGIIAALMSKFPDAPAAQIRTALISTAEPCCDSQFAGGRLNAVRAAAYMYAGGHVDDTVKPTIDVTTPADGATVSGTYHITGSAADDASIAKIELQIGATGIPFISRATGNFDFGWHTENLANGTQIPVRLTAFDISGNASTPVIRNVTINNGTTPPPTTPPPTTPPPTTPPPTTPPPGGNPKSPDINGSGKVDLTDLSILLSNWNKTTANADLNSSGKVDLTDLSMLLSKWNTAG